MKAIILFVLGLFLVIAAFLGGQEDHLPFVLNAISPDYMQAREALRRMQSTLTLGPHDPGFAQISRIFLKELALQNPPDEVASVSVVRIQRRQPLLDFSKATREVVSVAFELSNGQTLEWSLGLLMARVSELKKGYVFIASVALFVVGIILQIKGFTTKLQGERQPKMEERPLD